MPLNICVSQTLQTTQQRECLQRICIGLSVIPTRRDSASTHSFIQLFILAKWPTSVVRRRKPPTLDLAKLLHGSFHETRNLGLKLRKRWKSTEITMRNKKCVVSDNQEDWWAPSYTEGTALMGKMSTQIVQNCLFGLVRSPPPKKLENLSESTT